MFLSFGPVGFVLAEGRIPRDDTLFHFITCEPDRAPWPRAWRYELRIEGGVGGIPDSRHHPAPAQFLAAPPGQASFKTTCAELGFRLEVEPGLVVLRLMDGSRPSLLPALKTALCHVALVTLAAENAGLILHSSGTESQGHAHLFIGPHGQGKSTTANLLGKDQKLADDIVFVLDDQRGGLLCGGLTKVEKRVLPLESIWVLARGTKSAVGPKLAKAQAYRALLQRTVMWPDLLPHSAEVSAFVERLAGSVPCRGLTVNLEDLSRELLFPNEGSTP